MDQVIANQIGINTRSNPSPSRPVVAWGTTGRTHTLSFTKTGQPIPAEDNIRRCFNLLFGKDDTSLRDARHQLLLKKHARWHPRRLEIIKNSAQHT